MNIMPKTLLIDIGNTSTSIALDCDRTLSSIQNTSSIKPTVVSSSMPERAVIASVRPSVNKRWECYLKKQGIRNILWVNHTMNFGVSISYPTPETIGADRLANACEASATYGTPVVVCDFGTALTFDIIKKQEGYVGGIICPGLPLMFDYLAEKTELLPHIKPIKTTHLIGKDTGEAMCIGAHFGYLGMVKEILTQLKKELGENTNVCATGGFSHWVFNDWETPVSIDPNLTLKGLARIATLNTAKAPPQNSVAD